MFRLKPSEYLTQNEIDAASLVRTEELNTQVQAKITWPSSTPVALAYLDQVARTRGIQTERARAVRTALDRADDARGNSGRASAALDQLDAVATQLESDAASATGRDAMRLKALAATLKDRAARLRQ